MDIRKDLRNKKSLLIASCSVLALLAVKWNGLAVRGDNEAATAETEAQEALDVRFNPAIECWFHNRFPQIDASIQPPQGLKSVRLYFRCSSFSDFYFVDMAPGGEGFRALAPMAEKTCPSVVYYAEAVGADFDSNRTEEREADVTSDTECKRRDPGVAWFTGDNPEIIVGLTREGAATIPPGFQAAGIAGFITGAGAAAATASAGGTGIGAGTIAVGAVAAAGGAAAVVAATGGGEETTTTSTITVQRTTSSSSSTTSTVSTTTVTLGAALNACFSTNPSPPRIEEGESIQLDGRCSTPENAIISYQWDLGDGRRREGPLIAPRYNTPGAFNVELTVSDGTDTSSRTRVVTVTSRPTTTIYFRPQMMVSPSTSNVSVSYRSFLGVNPFDGKATGYIVANGTQTTAVSNAAITFNILRGRLGKNTIRAQIGPGGASQGGFWRFELSGSNFFPGSIVVREGRVLSVDTSSIVFRLDGTPGEIVEFEFQLIP
jgi:hypothetical protein